jgi:hypothetical protein
MELNARKLEYIRDFLNEDDEMLVKEQIISFWQAKSARDAIPGLPNTIEELKASIERGIEQYRQGKGITHAEFLKEQAIW